MARIPEMWPEIKGRVDALLASWGLAALVFGATVAAFGLGRLSALVDAKPLVEVHTAAVAASQAPMEAGGYYVASRNGSAYYFPWCAGADRIADRNKIWFSTEEEARAAGYRPAKNCKGLTD